MENNFSTPSHKIIYLARHADPDRTRTDLPYHLLPGPPLTEHGLLEAQQLGAYFHQGGVHSIISSPLERCLQTARIAAEISGATLSIEPALIEWQPDENPDGKPAALITHGGPIAVMLESLGMDSATLQSHRVYDHGNPLPTAAAWLAEQTYEEDIP